MSFGTCEVVKGQPTDLRAAIEELFKMGVAAAPVRRVKADQHAEGTPFVVVPDGFRVESVQGMALPNPDRVRGVAELYDLRSFCAYLNERKTPSTRIFARSMAAPFTLRAVIDFHSTAGTAEWATHEAKLVLTHTEPWEAWLAANGKEWPQAEFAAFIEERQVDIVDPDGATMLELAQSLRATQGATFSGRVNLSNHDSALAFECTTEAAAGKDGALTIPQLLRLRLSPFVGVPEQVVEARFRYRLERGSLRLSVHLVRPRELVRRLVEAAAEMVVAETGVQVFYGEWKA